MLQRVYGTAWRSAADLDAHPHRLEEAKRRDHRRLGQRLDLFAFDPAVGRGLPLWLPHGTAVRDPEDWAKEVGRRWGYVRVATPHITRAELHETSGHLPYFADGLTPPPRWRSGSSTKASGPRPPTAATRWAPRSGRPRRPRCY